MAAKMAAKERTLIDLQNVAVQLPRSRLQFIRDVEAAATHAVDTAKQIAPAIGEISIDEAKEATVREFADKLSIDVSNPFR